MGRGARCLIGGGYLIGQVGQVRRGGQVGQIGRPSDAGATTNRTSSAEVLLGDGVLGEGLLKGGGEELDVADHAEETIGACRGEVLFEAYLVDEVEVGMENVGRGLSAKYF